MSITVSGLGSGLSYDSWITELVGIKQKEIDAVSTTISTVNTKKTSLSTIETDYANLLDSIQAFTDTLSTNNPFSQKTATSSSDAITVTTSSSAKTQDITVTVSTLATATTASSADVVASYIDNNSKISEISAGAITDGTFSVYVDGSKNTVNITSSDKMSDVLSSLNSITGVSASLSADGKLTIASSGTSTVTIGSSSDTSNFKKAMGLTGSNNTYTSSKSLFDTDSSTALTSGSFAGATAITTGTFTIGTASFTIDSSTTLDGIINQINNNKDAGVKASWNATTGKLTLTSTDQGATNINIVAGDGTSGNTNASNFTDIMGLTTSSWDSGTGNLQSSSLKTGSQVLGKDAVLTINGTTITASSNDITSDISGLTGVTLTLKNTTSSAATISVTQDTSKVESAMKSFITAFNTAVSDTDTATATNGNLHGESILSGLRNKIRSLATSAVTGSNGYKTLASIGVTTGAIGTSVSANTNKLTLDSSTFEAALKADPDAVQKLLVGYTTTTSGTATTVKGIFTDIKTTITEATDAVDGYFTTRENSYSSQIKTLNKKVDTMTLAMEAYQKQLEAKFSAMDTIISNLKNSASVFDSYFKSKSSSS